MKKIFLSGVLLLAVASVVFAQNGSIRSLSNFNALSVAEGIKVTLVHGTKPQAKIVAHNIDLDEILTEVNGDYLKVHLEGNNHNNVKVSIEITYVNLSKVKASSAASVVGRDIIKADEFAVKASSAADISLQLDANKLDVDASSAADIELNGTAGMQNVDLSSASDYKGYGLLSKGAIVSVSSAADARINVTENLDASASSGGSIKYKGNPKKVREHSSSGGDVESY